MSMFTSGAAFVAHFRLDPARKEEFLRLLTDTLGKSGEFVREHVNFAFYGWGRDENEWIAIESWKNEDTLNQLRRSPEFATGVAQLMACCTAPVRLEVFAGLDQSRDIFSLYKKGVSEFHPLTDRVFAQFE